MKKLKANFLSLLVLAFCLCSAISISLYFNETPIAKAETKTYTVTELGIAPGTTNSVIYAYPVDQTDETRLSGGWDNAFTFIEASGYGFRINGNPHSGWTIKKPENDFYIELSYTAQVGDVFSIDGKFYNATLDICFIFENCALEYNGSTWISKTIENPPATESTIGEITAVSSEATKITLTTDKPLGINSWDYTFTYNKGIGVRYNDADFSNYAIKQPGTDLFVELIETTPAVGDRLLVDGTFYCSAIDTYITIPKISLRFDGTNWNRIYETGKLALSSDSSASGLYLVKADGTPFEKCGNWNQAFTLGFEGQITLNNKQISMINSVKIPSDKFIYVDLGATASYGYTVTISGELYNNEVGVTYYIEKSTFEWNGTTWVESTDSTTEKIFIEYLDATNSSSSTAIYAYTETGIIPKPGDWDNKYQFISNSGDGFLYNGSSCNYTMKQPGDLYLEFGATAKSGDAVTIDGAFYSAATNRTFYFNNCGLIYDGSKWTRLTTYKIPELTLHSHSAAGGAISSNNAQLYLKANSFEMPIKTWDHRFSSDDEYSFQINNQPATLNEMKSADGTIWLGFNAVSAGDKVTIGGVFVSKTLNVTYIVETSNFIWTGSNWENLPYTNVSVDSTSLKEGSNINTLLLSGASTENAQTLKYKSGNGFRVNGTPVALNEFTISSNGLHLSFDNLTANAVVTLSGTYVNEEAMVKYTFAESKFVWNGEFWETEGKPLVYEIGTVVIGNNSSSSAVYLNKANGSAFEITDSTWANENKFRFIQGSGNGITLNGVLLAMDDIKVPGNIYCGLGTTAVAGDVLVIGGSFYSETLNVRYVIEESTLVFDGEAWLSYDEYIATLEEMQASLNFAMLNGAAIRLTSSLDNSGIRFTTTLNNQAYTDLLALVASIEMGTLIMPYDYLSAGQAPNLQDFEAGKRVLKITSTEEKREVINDVLYFRGAMQKIRSKNYTRNFAGRGYMIITLKNGETIYYYTPFATDKNVRSIRSIANDFINDDSEPVNGELRYYNLRDDDPRKAVVNTYAGIATPATNSDVSNKNVQTYNVYPVETKNDYLVVLSTPIN